MVNAAKLEYDSSSHSGYAVDQKLDCDTGFGTCGSIANHYLLTKRMPSNEEVIYSLLTVLVIHHLWNKVLSAFRDASELYLNQQLVVDTVRNDGESPIYKSNKLDYLNGLRLGLNVRYEHYKIRNGNLNDVWELAMLSPSSTIQIDGIEVSRGQVNAFIQALRPFFHEKKIDEIHVTHTELSRPVVLLTILACLVAQVPVNVYVTTAKLPGWHLDGQYLSNGDFTCEIPFNPQVLASIDHFDNPYEPAKDKGTSIKLHYKANPHVAAVTEFTQSNIISAIASTAKHLPMDYTIDANDRLLVVEDWSTDTMPTLIKVLSLLMSPVDIMLARPNSWKQLMEFRPTILFITLQDWKSLWVQPSIFKSPFARIGSYFLAKGVYLSSSSLKLTYIHTSINNKQPIQSRKLNQFRALLSRCILEFSYHNVAGPVLMTDLYDYRDIPFKLKAYGCLSQSLEYKLTDMDSTKTGIINIRGFIIGRTNYSPATQDASQKQDGFMPLNVKGKWGSDGCLYIV